MVAACRSKMPQQVMQQQVAASGQDIGSLSCTRCYKNNQFSLHGSPQGETIGSYLAMLFRQDVSR